VRSLILLSSLQEDRDDKPGQEKTLRLALDRLQNLLEAYGPAPGTLADLATCRHNLGIVHRKTGRLASADSHLSQAVTLRRQLVTDFPRVAAYRNELGGSLRSLALARMEQDKLAEARKLLEEGRELQQKLCDEFGRVPQFCLNLAITLGNLALAHQLQGNEKEAERLLLRAAAIEQELTRQVPAAADYPSSYALSLHNLGLTCLNRKEYKAADRFFEQAIEWQDKARRANPAHALYRKRLRSHYQGRGEALAGLKDATVMARLARQWDKDLGSDWRDEYLAAALLARACPLSSEPKPLAEEAVKMLAQARQKGLRDPKLLRDNPAFAPLRDRQDYRDLLSGLDAQKER
jgi:tetratricopeptide (TPR) repeat protein